MKKILVFAVFIGIANLVISIVNNLKTQKFMSEINDKLVAFNQRLDAATTEIASDLQALKTQIENNSVTPEALDNLDATIAKLETMGTENDTIVSNPEPGV